MRHVYDSQFEWNFSQLFSRIRYQMRKYIRIDYLLRREFYSDNFIK